MAVETRKKKKAGTDTSDGETRKEPETMEGDDNVRVSRKAKRAASLSSRIEERLGEKLAGDETPRKRKKSRGRGPSSRPRESVDSVSSDDSDEPAKKRKRSRASSLPSASEHRKKRRKRRSKGLFGQLISMVPGIGPRDYDEMIDKLERMDEFGKAPDVDGRLEAFLTFLYEKYWRVDTAGLESIPDTGRALIVSNHSGVLPFDGAMMATAIYNLHPAGRIARFLIEDWFGQLPFATEFMNAVGQVRACQENAERLLNQEQLVGVFPEGIKGMAKGFKDRYNLARFGRGGVIRLAIRTRAPVIPCAVVGAEEIYIVLGYANWLGKIFGMPLFPISATFPWLGPLGFIPLPTKWYIQFGKVISYAEYDESALKDNVIINRLNRQLRATVQEMVDTLLKKRRSLFFG